MSKKGGMDYLYGKAIIETNSIKWKMGEETNMKKSSCSPCNIAGVRAIFPFSLTAVGIAESILPHLKPTTSRDVYIPSHTQNEPPASLLVDRGGLAIFLDKILIILIFDYFLPIIKNSPLCSVLCFRQ